jgi:hypothetical protein
LAIFDADAQGDHEALARSLEVSEITEWPPTDSDHDADAVSFFAKPLKAILPLRRGSHTTFASTTSWWAALVLWDHPKMAPPKSGTQSARTADAKVSQLQRFNASLKWPSERTFAHLLLTCAPTTLHRSGYWKKSSSHPVAQPTTSTYFSPRISELSSRFTFPS